MSTYNTECPKKTYAHKVNIPYYIVYTYFLDTLYASTCDYFVRTHVLFILLNERIN